MNAINKNSEDLLSLQANNLLSIQHLSVQFKTLDGNINAIDDVNINVSKNEIVAIVGESGSGKSVTSLSILQLHPTSITNYSSGNIFYTNSKNKTIDLLKCTDDDLQEIRGNEIAMIFQEPMTSLNPVMQCGKQITEVLIKHKNLDYQQAKTKTIQLFNDVKIPNPVESFNKYPHEFSGGQKQRVMIAMAMCCNPQLLICDEPTTALDVTVQKSILQLIKKLQKENKMGVLFISHDLGLVKSIADKIVVMYKGKIVEQGTALQVLNNPQHNYTKALLACRPSLYQKGEPLPIVADFVNSKIEKKEIFVTQRSNIDSSILFDIQKLTICYTTKKNIFGKITNQFTAINNISFQIFKGETLGLVGESGCGKTTLGRAILQLQTITKGSILYQNKNISEFSNQEKRSYRKDVQIIFQDPYSSLNPRITIGAALKEVMLVNKLCTIKNVKNDVINLLHKVELKSEHYERYPHEFSGGQRQRLVIARALAMQPKFIVCDESVSALDVSVQAQILNLLNKLKQDLNFTILFISHDLSVIKYMCDRIMVMQNGNIVDLISNDELNSPQIHQYTKTLMESIPS